MQVKPFAKQVLEQLKGIKKALINVHPNPDLDTIGSSIALKRVLEAKGIAVDIICPDSIDPSFDVLQARQHIQTVDFTTVPYQQYDCFFIVDTRDIIRMTGGKELTLPDMPVFVIDHHEHNTLQASARLVEETATSSSFLLYHVFREWDVEITSEIATCLLAGILIDTEFLKYMHHPVETTEVVTELLKKGARMQDLVQDYFSTKSVAFLQLIGACLGNMHIEDRCMWSAIPYSTYEQLGHQVNAREAIANMFFRNVQDTDVGVLLMEEAPDVIQISFRSSSSVDVAAIAKFFGGGGHKERSGATVHGNLTEITAGVITVCKQHIPSSGSN